VFLSQLVLNPRDARARRDLASPYELHRTVLSVGFDGVTMGDIGRVLFRADADPAGRTPPVVLVQSEREPDWTRLPAGYTARGPACKSFDPRFRVGQRLRFRLRANPTKKVRLVAGHPPRGVPGRNGKRVALLKEDDQIAWLVRQGKEHPESDGALRGGGFRPVTVRPVPPRDEPVYGLGSASAGWAFGHKTDDRTGTTHALTFHGVVFEGHLEVTHAERFADAVRHGVGPGKACGFGLLSVAPA